MPITILVSTAALIFAAVPAAAQGAAAERFVSTLTPDETAGQQAVIETMAGTVILDLLDEAAPNHVAHFITEARAGRYDGTVFHRVIKGFMVQGGGFEAGMKQKPTDAPIRNEANNGLKNNRYTLAMARTSDPHSASAQFFINAADNEFLNFKSESGSGWGYAVFGKVVGGTEVVDAIEGVKTGRKGFHDDVPLEDVLITRAVVV